MPSRRRLLTTCGAALVGGLAGCTTDRTTSGRVERKLIDVAIPRSRDEPIDVTVALLTFERDRELVTGEYADIADGAVEGASIVASETVHRGLSDRFAAVRYLVNIVPEDGSKPANGLVTRAGFNDLSVGGTAAVDPYWGDDGVGHLRVERSAPRERDPTEITVSQYDWEERVDGLLGVGDR